MRNGILYQVDEIYTITANYLFNQLFPEGVGDNIKNIVVIRDGLMSIIPFEALFTEDYMGDDYEEMPYLIKECNISYALSANLFHATFQEALNSEAAEDERAHAVLFAPVFADESTGGVHSNTRSVLGLMDDAAGAHNKTEEQKEKPQANKLLSGATVTPLPGTEAEVHTIHSMFQAKQLDSKALTHDDANEEFIKNGGLRDHRFIHIATHGFVNEETPELSGVLLAQDPNSHEDGILYAGEIYNINLNADLITLSACETGLGKITKGEGVLGLMRALLYAGSKNVMVSLWKVSDESTAELMADFYKSVIEKEHAEAGAPLGYSKLQEHLRNAKLTMIHQAKFAKPYYWSPFILIGY
jgi:CHAT domain-containing protein